MCIPSVKFCLHSQSSDWLEIELHISVQDFWTTHKGSPETTTHCRLWELSPSPPYYCRLGDLLCFVFMSDYCMFDLSCTVCTFSTLILLVGYFDL